MKSKHVLWLIAALLLLFLLFKITQPGETAVNPTPGAEVLPPEETVARIYGFPADSFEIVHGTIKKNEFLADILLRHGVDYTTIDAIAKKSKGIYDVRYLRSGKNYVILLKKDSARTAEYFIYEPNAIEYVVFHLSGDMEITKGEKEISTEIKTASGTIESSLFLTLTDQDLSPLLALKMADIYAWTIDFYRLQKGDWFKVIYEEKLVNGEPIGIGRILACDFNHSGNDFYAFLFDQGDGDDYFDENGQSLRKAFLKSPLKFGRMTSGYTMRRFHPVQKRYKAHLGTDYAAPTGTPIMATGDGIVTEARYKQYNGNYVKIRHNSTYSTQYLHMSRIAKGIRPGAKVKQGQVIGYVGSTGLATGPHVCYRFWKNGKQVDARKQKIPPSKPVKKSKREEYEKHMITWKEKLDQIGLNAE